MPRTHLGIQAGERRSRHCVHRSTRHGQLATRLSAAGGATPRGRCGRGRDRRCPALCAAGVGRTSATTRARSRSTTSTPSARRWGIATINIYGGSYGATTGQIYLLRHRATCTQCGLRRRIPARRSDLRAWGTKRSACPRPAFQALCRRHVVRHRVSAPTRGVQDGAGTARAVACAHSRSEAGARRCGLRVGCGGCDCLYGRQAERAGADPPRGDRTARSGRPNWPRSRRDRRNRSSPTSC